MRVVLHYLIAAALPAGLHLVLIIATGHDLGLALGTEIVVRWMIGAILILSVTWPIPVVLSGAAIGFLLGLATAMTLNTVRLTAVDANIWDNDPIYAVLTNTLVGVALGLGSLIGSAIGPRQKSENTGPDDTD